MGSLTLIVDNLQKLEPTKRELHCYFYGVILTPKTESLKMVQTIPS